MQMEPYAWVLEAKRMAGSTIDHLVSLMIFIGALLVFISLFNQTIQTAILYQRHRFLATKCSDLLDNILLNPGIPADWGESGAVPSVFGLQDRNFTTQYRLSPFSLMRLLSSSGDLVYYSRTGNYYSNVSWGVGGGYFLLKESECVTYDLASKLLGVNGTYGFQLAITPILTVDITEVRENPLKFKIQVSGLGSPLSNANLTYLMFWSNPNPSGDAPILNFTSSDVNGDFLKTDSLGIAYKEFSSDPYIRVDNNKTAYVFIVRVQLGGLYGVGYKARDVTTSAGNIIPFVESYEDGTVLLAHKWGKNDPSGNQGALFFNASFYVLSENFVPMPEVQNVTGHVNYGKEYDYYAMQIPPSKVGFLVVAYRKGNEYGMVVMPWGVGVVGLSVVFGGDPVGQEWVAADIRQVIVNGVAYQARLALWSLEGYGVVG
ncbi:MAG: hypothetical protein QW270_07315 [Candidatus Bathyarchaeia archaeon]